MFRAADKKRAIALIMAIAIMAVLAVVGFGFASSMKLEHAATRAIRNLAQARMSAHAAIQLVAGALITDATAEPGTETGPLADHSGEALFSAGLSQQLAQWGNLSIMATASFVDEARKMNLNAFGNISKWDYDQCLDDVTASGISSATNQLYHGANERFSSFEVSFEEFFYKYYTDGRIWGTGDPYEVSGADLDKTARVPAAANLARAICLYRYGGKHDGNGDETPDYAGNGRPGHFGPTTGDDDKDNDYGTNGVDDDRDGPTDGADLDEVGFGLAHDGIDNDGDGTVDEPYEGYDEPDEFNPYSPAGDDHPFDSISEFKDAIGHAYNISSGTAPGGGFYPGKTVPAAVNYTGAMDANAVAAEAERIYNLVKNDLTVHSYNLDIRSVSIDDPGRDGYDNDGDGKVDQDDTTGATTIAQIKAQLDAEKTIYEVDINERDIDKRAQAAYIYWKLTQDVTYTKSDGTTVTQPLVTGFTLKNALDIVDYRDTDCIPTKIEQNDVAAGVPAEHIYGTEGLHITEVGRFMPNVDAPACSTDGDKWAAGGGGFTANIEATDTLDDKTCVLTFSDPTDLKNGKYLVKMNVDVPDGGLLRVTTDPGGGDANFKDVNADGTIFIGPLVIGGMSAGANKLELMVQNGTGAFTVSNIEILLPYIEVMNMSRQPRDMTRFNIQIGAQASTPVTNVKGASDGTTSIAGFKTSADFKKGYQYFVIVYDETSFDNNFPEGTSNGTWGDADEDFPIAVMPDLFANGFDGNQNVKLWEGGSLVAGDVIDGFHADGIGQCKPFSATTLAASRLIAAGDLSYCTERAGGDMAYKIRPEMATDGVTPSTSPGRWNRNDGKYGPGTSFFPDYFWPQVEAEFVGIDSKGCDMVVLRDTGYFLSPGEIASISSPRLWLSTLSFWPNWSQNDGTYQPLFKELLAYVVTARAPARVNINTASDAVMTAALLDAEPGLDSLRNDCRPFVNVEALCLKDDILNVFITATPADDDADNVKDDYFEREEWYKRHSNTFTLRSFCFSVTVSGQITNPTGAIVAQHNLRAICDRGRSLSATGDPAVSLLSLTPGETSE